MAKGLKVAKKGISALNKAYISAIMTSIIIIFLLTLYTSAWAEVLTASWYSKESLVKEGTWKYGERRMANGERFDDNASTCACNLYNLGTLLRVTRILPDGSMGKSIKVVVKDRIGRRFTHSRIDIPRGTFIRLAPREVGLIKVKIEEVI